MATSGTSSQEEHRDQRHESVLESEAAGTWDDIEECPGCDIPFFEQGGYSSGVLNASTGSAENA
ncbi:hypothetical protein LTR37_016444 [Vermiconidia calcicola]|uniref:Uncharacterized protein n=1 Tax=Vermiconidia calcicola TaxID=1690605 RepID=A0ACC3MNI0_9PEZI|nr:hypothetical protein LTR37_016444 [Vermiconidia calcicola]